MRERVEAMKEIWTKDEAEYHGEFVDFDPIWCWPKPTQKPHPPVLLGGSGPKVLDRVLAYADEWTPNRFGSPRSSRRASTSCASEPGATCASSPPASSPTRELVERLEQAGADGCTLYVSPDADDGAGRARARRVRGACTDGPPRRARPLAQAVQGRGGRAPRGGLEAAGRAAARARRQAARLRARAPAAASCSRAGTRPARAARSSGSSRRSTPATCAWRSSPRRRRTSSATTSSGASGRSCPDGAGWPSSTAPGTGACWWSAWRGSRSRSSGSERYDEIVETRAHARRRGSGDRQVLAARLRGGAAASASRSAATTR